jgi:hypothetical protein
MQSPSFSHARMHARERARMCAYVYNFCIITCLICMPHYESSTFKYINRAWL